MGKYLKKFTTGQEYDAYLEGSYLKPNVSYIVNQKTTTYNNSLFPIHITLKEIDSSHDYYADTTIKTKKLYDYYMANCILDPMGAQGETILELTDEQELYIDGIKVTQLYQDGYTVSQKTVQWYPNNLWDASAWYYGGGIHADGSIYVEYDD